MKQLEYTQKNKNLPLPPLFSPCLPEICRVSKLRYPSNNTCRFSCRWEVAALDAKAGPGPTVPCGSMGALVQRQGIRRLHRPFLCQAGDQHRPPWPASPGLSCQPSFLASAPISPGSSLLLPACSSLHLEKLIGILTSSWATWHLLLNLLPSGL